MGESQDDRRARLSRQFSEAMTRFLARVERAGADAEHPRPDGWNVAQIGWHVAKVNDSFAGLMTGRIPGAEPAPASFAERPWPDIVAGLPEKISARGPSIPPPDVSLGEALGRLRASGQVVSDAIAALTPERGSGLVVHTPLTGVITLYQVAEWATAHVIRHNAQAKAVLGR